MRRGPFYVYILTNTHNTVLYIGVTNDIGRRLDEHRSRTPGSFTARYNIHKLVHLEVHASIRDAIAREKQLKHWHRPWKLDLIRQHNPKMLDLAPPLHPAPSC